MERKSFSRGCAMQASLIIAVYNQARNLELILETVKQQTCKDIEIVIADDGSSDRTVDVLENFRASRTGIPLSFVTQEDKGFRKTMILNKAIKLAKTDYLVFIDGDMLLDSRFVELHLRYRQKNHVLCGHRGVKFSNRTLLRASSGESWLICPTLSSAK